MHLLSLVQGGLTATDVFAVEWIKTGIVHYGLTVSYYGFVSDGKPVISIYEVLVVFFCPKQRSSCSSSSIVY